MLPGLTGITHLSSSFARLLPGLLFLHSPSFTSGMFWHLWKQALDVKSSRQLFKDKFHLLQKLNKCTIINIKKLHLLNVGIMTAISGWHVQCAVFCTLLSPGAKETMKQSTTVVATSPQLCCLRSKNPSTALAYRTCSLSSEIAVNGWSCCGSKATQISAKIKNKQKPAGRGTS